VIEAKIRFVSEQEWAMEVSELWSVESTKALTCSSSKHSQRMGRRVNFIGSFKTYTHYDLHPRNVLAQSMWEGVR